MREDREKQRERERSTCMSVYPQVCKRTDIISAAWLTVVCSEDGPSWLISTLRER